MHEFEAFFWFRSKLDSRYSFDDEIEYGETRIKTEDGKICGRTTVRIGRNDPNLAREKAIKKLEELGLILTLIFEKGFTIEDVKVQHKPVIKNKGKNKKISLSLDVQIKPEVPIKKRYSKDKIKIKLKRLTNKIEKHKDFLRVIKWWSRGNLEEDDVDKFLNYFISFEMIASIKGYKSKYKDNWAKFFSEDYSITYKPDGKMTINQIRNKIMHEPGKEKEIAEKLACSYANGFGEEILRAIKKIIDN